MSAASFLPLPIFICGKTFEWDAKVCVGGYDVFISYASLGDIKKSSR